MEQELNFFRGICEEQTKKIHELERILKHNKSIDSTWKKARDNWRKKVMEDKELFELLKERGMVSDDGYFLDASDCVSVEGV